MSIVDVLPSAEDRAVYTVPEVSKLLGISLGMAYLLVREGEIPARKMGARWVIPKQRFHAWLNAESLDDAAGWS